MGSAQVLYLGSSEIAVLSNAFTVAGIAADPTTVSCVVTAPDGTVITHTFAGASPADITKLGTGDYQLNQPCTIEGMWAFVWIGTGAVSDISPGTFTVSLVSLSRLYCSVSELKSRIGMASTDTSDDDQLLLACQAATRGIDQYTGRYFWAGTDTRVFSSESIEVCPVDDLVSITTLSTDSTGLGTFDQTWAASDYRLEPANAPTPSPEPAPYTRIRALAAGGGRFYFPAIFPMSNPERVKIVGVFGWPAVPYAVKQACLQVAEDIYKLKDAPFGVLGSPDGIGLMRVTGNPRLQGQLWSYVRGKDKIGI